MREVVEDRFRLSGTGESQLFVFRAERSDEVQIASHWPELSGLRALA